MTENGKDTSILKPAGYNAPVKQYDLDITPNRHKSFVAISEIHLIYSTEGLIEDVYPYRYWPGDTPGGHHGFALKYDGTNLAIHSFCL